MKKPVIRLTLLLFPLLFVPFAWADGSTRSDEWAVKDYSREPLNRGSDASFDKRLPPVLPGERVNDSGKRSRVWSTSGPVPVSEAPSVAGTRDKSVLGNVDVVIDERSFRRNPERR